MLNWLKHDGARGLYNIEIASFEEMGRGIKTLIPIEKDCLIMAIPKSTLWTTDAADNDPLIGTIIKPLSTNDKLAMFILFVKSHKTDYEDRWQHVDSMPKICSGSLFFTNEELEICKGSALSMYTQKLRSQIVEDYAKLQKTILSKNQDLFPPDKFTLEEVITRIFY